jgi:glycosyltransferase involved in cell wall biosynthesis
LKKLAIVTTHPIQYNAPLFRLLTERKQVDIKVFYTWGEKVLQRKFDPGFGKNIKWDIPLLEGYEYQFVENVASDPGSHHFSGIDNPTLIKDIKDCEADAVLVYGWKFKSHLSCLRYFYKKIPVYFRGDSILTNQKSPIKSLATKFVLTWVYHHVDKAFYVGTENKKYFLNFGLKSSQLVFVPHAVDNLRFADKNDSYEHDANEWKLKFGIQPAELVIVYAGKLEPIKNLDWLIDSIKKRKEVAMKLIVVGNGPLEKELKEKVSGDGRFLFIDFQNQTLMPVVYRLGQVFILCSKSETWGLSINEAMASGRAILASETCGCVPDLVKNNLNGYVFKLTNPEDLIGKIKTLSSNKDLVKRMGAESLGIINNWNYEKACEAIENAVYNITSE